jgi:hypothetical protein
MNCLPRGREPEFTPIFNGVGVAQYLISCVFVFGTYKLRNSTVSKTSVKIPKGY